MVETGRSAGNAVHGLVAKELAPIGELVAADNKPVPWAIDVAGLNVVFNASTQLSLVPEYEMLVDVALQLWEHWRVRSGLP